MRGESKRAWIKVHIHGILNGSVRYQLESAERGVWLDLLCFAGLGIQAGTISDNDLRPFPHSFLANRFNISPELLEETLQKCQVEGRITEDEHGIHITNWPQYQSEYQRQRPYRQKSKLPEPDSLKAYAEELKAQFPDLDLTAELVKFRLYWSEGNRKLKRPKLALLNWMNKAKEIKNAANRKDTKPGIPGNRPAGAFADLQDRG